MDRGSALLPQFAILPFDFIRDTAPVASIMQLTNMMVVPMGLPVKTVQELIDYCKANPGKVSYASSGNGTSVHMSAAFPKPMNPAQFGKLVADETEKWRKVVAFAGVSVD